MAEWNPADDTFRLTASRILSRAQEAAVRHLDDGQRQSDRELAARGISQGGASIRAGETLSVETIERFAAAAWPELMSLIREAVGDPPPAAAVQWLRDTFTQHLDGLVRGLSGRLVEKRERMRVPTDGAAVAVVRAGERAKRDMEIELGRLELRSTAARRVVGDVVLDFLGLAREALNRRSPPDAKNVAAVLVAAAFEDTIRRMGATLAGVTGRPDLSDVLQALKAAGVLVGAPFTTAQGFLKFRNDALHADWAQIDRPVIESCRAFVEELLAKHFS